MSEAVEVVTDYWFEILKFPRQRVPKAVPNVASRRISEKQGMRVVGREITAAEWARWKSRRR